jgi:hypothetical protein
VWLPQSATHETAGWFGGYRVGPTFRRGLNLSLGGNMGYQEELRWLRSRAQACQQLDVRAAVLAAIDDELTYLRNEASKPWVARQPEGGDIGIPLKREQ